MALTAGSLGWTRLCIPLVINNNHRKARIATDY